MTAHLNIDEITEKIKSLNHSWVDVEESMQNLVDINDEIVRHMERIGEEAAKLYVPLTLIGAIVAGFYGGNHRPPARVFGTEAWKNFSYLSDRLLKGAKTKEE